MFSMNRLQTISAREKAGCIQRPVSAHADARGKHQDTYSRQEPMDYTYQRFSLKVQEEKGPRRNRETFDSTENDKYRFSSRKHDDQEEVSSTEEEYMDEASTSGSSMLGDKLYGVFPVLNALKAKRRSCHALYVLSSLDLSKRKDAAAMRDVFKLAKEMDLEVIKVSRHELNVMSDYRQHQGLVLDCSSLQWNTLDTFPTSADLQGAGSSMHQVWLALDEVTDPQNFGAIIRSAHCLGVSGIVACTKNCAPLSSTVSKASAGALEVAEVHSCQNMVKTLSQAVVDGWEVLGAASDTRAKDCRSVALTKPTILVMGNEGTGLRTNIKRACTGFVKVEMGLPKQLLAADSLNVSVAAGILVHSLLGAKPETSPTVG
ncbi:hypothetical protein CEUSTIGMA_g8197.t1 [Chlamydomonas eustigma]|uniref:rRNA methyltransferase 1, mitochondrial n=1 Tax=Chlamydomonas eustigma TaxID=1157962 RepID=A0A250XCZ6_9CHLO|nr:hypothetical protein CEUSTIGMA_g8197.t1 [Chlamydomonas eustigma]|eukprot:GAX80762.1 hypothetical protein CEUSTIGMA_g8197.t1 [Chlamydomonas eustigma]